MSLRAAACFSVVVAALLPACDSNTGFDCPCLPCTTAISVQVVDPDGAPIVGDWSVEAALDGFPVDTTLCEPGNRGNSNTCGFGNLTGVYEVVVRSPREEKELKARFAERAGENCCNCITGEIVQVVLEEG